MLLLLIACTGPDEGGWPEGVTSIDMASATPADPTSFALVETGAELVESKSGFEFVTVVECDPDVSDWYADPEDGFAVGDLPDGLRGWCVGSAPSYEPRVTDHLAVTTTSAANEAAMVAFDEAMLAFTVGAVVPPSGWTTHVRLAILDTSPTTGRVVPRGTGTAMFGPFDRGTLSDHGVTLANLAGNALCGDEGPQQADGSGCLVNIRTRVTLPITEVVEEDGYPQGRRAKRDYDTGGALGSLRDLTVAVVAETMSYMAGNSGSAEGLVLNVSAGFDPRWAHPDPTGDWSLPARRLFDALAFARCNGALLVAAEGNADHPGEGNTMLLPAGWYAPSTYPDSAPPDCARYAAAPRWDATGPLVFPVGGVDAGGDVLLSAIALPRSRVRAYGGYSSVPLPAVSYKGDPPETNAAAMTGSSIAALHVSVVAAARWADLGNCPDTPSAEGMDDAERALVQALAGCHDGTVPASTEVVDLLADPTGTNPPLLASFGDRFLPCPDGGPCAVGAGTAPTWDSAFPLRDGTPAAMSCVDATAVPPGCSNVLAVQYCAENGTVAPTPPVVIPLECEGAAAFSTAAHPYVMPQPPPPYCPACYFDPVTKDLYVKDPPISSTTGVTTLVPAAIAITSAGRETVYGGFSIRRTEATYSLTNLNFGALATGTPTARLIVYENGTQSSASIRYVQK